MGKNVYAHSRGFKLVVGAGVTMAAIGLATVTATSAFAATTPQTLTATPISDTDKITTESPAAPIPDVGPGVSSPSPQAPATSKSADTNPEPPVEPPTEPLVDPVSGGEDNTGKTTSSEAATNQENTKNGGKTGTDSNPAVKNSSKSEPNFTTVNNKSTALALTGTNTAIIAGIGGVLTVGGVTILLVTRKRRAA